MKFTIRIIPTSQARSRSRGFVKTMPDGTKKWTAMNYKDPKQAKSEDHIIALMAAYQPQTPFVGPVALLVKTYMPIPASWSKKKKQQALIGANRPTGKPDMDNMIKQIKDCMTELSFWGDDKQVVEYLPGTGKYYDDGHGPRWEIEIVEVTP